MPPIKFPGQMVNSFPSSRLAITSQGGLVNMGNFPLQMYSECEYHMSFWRVIAQLREEFGFAVLLEIKKDI